MFTKIRKSLGFKSLSSSKSSSSSSGTKVEAPANVDNNNKVGLTCAETSAVTSVETSPVTSVETSAVISAEFTAVNSAEITSSAETTINDVVSETPIKQVVDESKMLNQEGDLSQFPFHGVSIEFLEEWIASNESLKKRVYEDGITTSQLINDVIEYTKEKQCSLAVKILQSDKPDDASELATHFISHAWSYKFRDLLDGIQILKKEESKAYIWFDLFSVCQHESVKKEYSTDFWSNIFHKSIKKIGHTVLVLYPYDAPLALKRSWCLWEIYGTAIMDVKLTISIVPSEVSRFQEALLKDPFGVVANLSTIDAKNADAFFPEDKERILKAATEAPGGLITVQNTVVEPIRVWMTAEARKMIAELVERLDAGDKEIDPLNVAYACNQVGLLLGEQGRYKEQFDITNKAIMLYAANNGKNTVQMANAINNLGELLRREGKYQDALDMYNIAAPILKTGGEKYFKSYGRAINNIAVIYGNLGKYPEAEKAHREALEYRIKSLGEKHEDVAASYNNLGLTLKRMKRYEEALDFYNKALELKREILNPDSPDIALGLVNLGSLLMALKKYDEAEPILREALDMDRKCLGENHPDTATDYNNLAICLYSRDSASVEAKEIGKKCLDIRLRMLGPDHEATKRALKDWGS